MPKTKLLALTLATLALTSCAPFSIKDHRAGVCNTLNSDMIFSGGTSNTRAADIERAQKPLLRRSYDDDCYQPPKYKKSQSSK